MKRTVLLVLCVLGTVLPMIVFVPWLAINGFNVPALLREAFATRVSAFAWLDVLVSALVLFAWMTLDEQRPRPARLAWPILGTLTVGVSLGFPLYLLLREERT